MASSKISRLYKYHVGSDMASLHELVVNNMVNVGDRVEFSFKGNHFSCKILRGGLLSDCFLQKAHETTPSKVLTSTLAFSSLTAWTEACLQDVLEEYYTRYSSWKRVYHVNSKRSMGDIRDQYQITKEVKSENIIEVHKEVLRLQHMIREMNTYIRSITDSVNCKQWSYMNVADVVHDDTEVTGAIDMVVDDGVHKRAQFMFCSST